MKKWRFLALAVLALALLPVAAAAVPFERYGAIISVGDRIYALVSVETGAMGTAYAPSKIREYDKYLNRLRELVLEDNSGNAARNSLSIGHHNGKLYIGSIGGVMAFGTTGDIWEVDIGAWTARQVFTEPNMMVLGLDIANDGTVCFLIGNMDTGWFPGAAMGMYFISADDLSIGALAQEVFRTNDMLFGGAGMGVSWNEAGEVAWVMAGMRIGAFGKNGSQVFPWAQGVGAGGNFGWPNVMSAATADRGAFYVVTDNMFGVSTLRHIRRNPSNTAYANTVLVTSFGGDTSVFAFETDAGRHLVLLREYSYGPNDNIFIYDVQAGFIVPIVNVSDWGTSNIHAIATIGNYLYLATYESYEPGNPNELSGGIVQVDMNTWRVVQPSNDDGSCDGNNGGDGVGGGGDSGGSNIPDDNSSSSGCNSGAGMLTLLLIACMKLLKNRRKYSNLHKHLA